jgi:hypothetical protein
MSPRRLSTCPGLVISFPGRTRWAVVFGRVLSQIDPGPGLRRDRHRRRNERHRDQHCSGKPTHGHSLWPGSVAVFLPIAEPSIAAMRSSSRVLESPHLAATFRQPARRRTISTTTRRRSSTRPGCAYSFPGTLRAAAFVGRKISQIGFGLGSDIWAIAGVMNAIEINNAAASVRMNTSLGPDLLA